MCKSRWYVMTSTGLVVYGPATKVSCNAYLRNALSRGSEPGYLRIVRA